MQRILITFAVLCFFPFLVSGTFAQTSEDEAKEARPLSSLQQQIQRDYERFEKSLYDVAEQSRGKDPERAELLYRARSQSQEQRILSDMELIAELLAPQKDGSPARYGPAADQQIELLERMETVLKLLQSLDERSRIDAEIKRLEELLKDTTRLIARQKDVRADTQRSDNSEKLKGDQERVAKDAEKLSEKIDKQDKERAERDGKKSDGKNSEEGENSSEKNDGKEGDSSDSSQENSQPGKNDMPQDGEPNAGEPADPKDSQEGKSANGEQQEPQEGGKGEMGEPSEGEGKPMEGESEQSEGQKPSGEPSEGEQSQGQKPQGQQQQGQPGQRGQQSQGQQNQQQQDEQTPGREELEQARQKMQKAIEKLEQENQDQAVEDQDAAVAKLEKLKAELEEILRQLREEERETYLTLLEARFQIMLKRQERINKDTKRLFNIAEADRLQQNYSAQTENVRKEQGDNVLDAEKTLNLLKEEGSSVAFPEAIEQMMQNMLVAESRLAKDDTGKTTQLVEALVLETLEEMIAALQKELEKMEEKKQQQQQQQQQGQPQDPGLVDQIAELKMIRSLQNQINRLTTQLSEEIGDDRPGEDQVKLIEDLAGRQQRIKDATYDLSIGRNK